MCGLARICFWNLVAVGLLAAPAWAQSMGIQWQHDLESAKAAAAQSGRMVLVHFWTPSCGPCLALEQTVFNQPTVAAGIQSRFVPVKLNADECPEIARGFGITKVPTDVIITPQGTMVGKIISPATPSAYLAEVHQVANRFQQGSGSNYRQAIAGAPKPGYVNPAYANLNVNSSSPSGRPQMGMPPNGAMGQGYANYRPGMPPGQNPTGMQNSAGMMAGQNRPPMGMNNAPPPYQPPIGQPAQQQDRYAMAPPNPNMYQPMGTNPPQDLGAPQPPKSAPPMENPYVGPSQASAPPHPNNPPLNGGPALIGGSTASAPPTSRSAEPPARSSIAASGVSLPPDVPPLGFDGYCPVAMRKSWQWVSGDPQWGAIHRGRTYLFSNEPSRDEFLRNPDFYAPALSGIDPVLAIEQNQMISGRREHSLDYDNQFFFFSNEATLEQFRRSPERYVDGVRQAMGLAQQASR